VGLPAIKRYLVELLHNYKLSYEEIGAYTGIDPERIKAIRKGEEPTEEEKLRIREVAFSLAELRQKDIGETLE